MAAQYASSPSRFGDRPPPLNTSLAVPQAGHDMAPMTPMTPSTPSGKRKLNPLQDLMETEKIYVEQLTGIIRKVASAWSRSNLPPPELDKMFRGIESIYKSNRSLAARLNEIGGADPSATNPTALGDLLMRWIDDLETPYTNYCTRFMGGFNDWSPITSNSRLLSVLATFSAIQPPPLPAGSDPHPAEPPLWTLDTLFMLPRHRLKYYRKLYGRLLKSTTEGRSDHRLLLGAVDRLDYLMQTLDERASIDVASVAPPPPVDMEDEVVMDLRQARISAQPEQTPHPEPASTRVSSPSESLRGSVDSRTAALGRSSTGTISMPIADLERRLATDRTLDIFTMKPKSVRLQISPPTLTHSRELLLSADVLITVTPRATGVEVAHEQGHIYILSDLFLIGERMTAEERAAWSPGGPDTWLCYPPLAGKHLRLTETSSSPTSFQVVIMKKETLTITTETTELRDLAIAKFRECISFAGNLATATKAREAPPMPSLDSLVRPSPAVSPAPSTQFGSNVGTPASDRARSPTSGLVSPSSVTSPTGSMDRRFSPPAPTPVQQQQSMDRRFSPPAPAPFQQQQQQQQQQDVRPLQMGLRLSDPPLPSIPPSTQTPHTARQFDSGGPPGDFLPPPPRAPFATPTRPGSAPIPDKPLPPFNGQGPPGHHNNSHSFGPGQFMPPQGMGPGQGQGQGQGQGPGPGQFMPPGSGGFGGGRPPGPGGFGPPPMQQQHQPGPHGYGQPRNMTAPGMDPRHQGPGGPMPPGGSLRKSASSGALAAQFDQAPYGVPRPPMPGVSGGGMPPGGIYAPQARMLLPSALQDRVVSSVGAPNPDLEDDMSPPTSPRMSGGALPTGPVVSSVIAQMKCKVFLQQQHQQWKSLGGANLRLFLQEPINVKQLVVEADDKKRTLLISTIVLTDGVERVGKTGVAITLSNNGVRTGVIYMIQLKNETSAKEFFDTLLQGSDRRAR